MPVPFSKHERGGGGNKLNDKLLSQVMQIIIILLFIYFLWQESVSYSRTNCLFADDSPPPVSMDVTYDLRCQSDGMRVTRHSRVSSMACCPVTEKSVALMVTDSRVVFWDMLLVDAGVGFMLMTMIL
jgi:hypothetical protein